MRSLDRPWIPSAAALALLALAPLLPAAAAAQEQPAEIPEFKEQLEVTEVLLDVLVTDAKGNVILGLGPQDFVVEEGGQQVALTGATFYSNRRLVESADVASRLGVAPSDVPVDRFFILFFDDQRRTFPALIRNELDAVRRAREWALEELLPNDWVAVAGFDSKLKIFQDFTADRSLVDAALTDVAKGRDPSGNWPSRQAKGDDPSLLKHLPKGRDLRKQTPRIYSALELLAEAAGRTVGRKNLLLFSIGFGEVNDFGTYLPDERYYPRMMQAINDNNVAVYSISLFREASAENQAVASLGNALSLLSSDSGGKYYFNFVNFREPLQQVTEDNNGYYLLSYSAEHPRSETGYRKVRVKTKNPSFVVRAREGYLLGS